MKAFLSLVFCISFQLALGEDAPAADQRVRQEFENLRSQERVSLVVLQGRLEQTLEICGPAKENLLRMSAVLSGLIPRAERSFDKKAMTALKETLDRYAADVLAPNPELYLRELESVSKNARPAYEGHDHSLFATGIILASIARGMAHRSIPSEKAAWHYVAGEAQFAATKSGTKDFEAFLKLASTNGGDRVAKAKARVELIQKLDREK